MQDKGYNVTGVKYSTKFQAMKRTFKNISDHNKKSGNNRKQWEYFEVLHIYVHTHTHTHTHTHARTHAPTHARTHARTHIYAYTHVSIYII